MSHKITTKTQITQQGAAEAALKEKAWDYSVNDGTQIRIQSGPLGGATLNLLTGEISGDTDYHTKDNLRALNQDYAKHMVMQDVLGRGGMIESVEQQQDGRIRVLAEISGL